VDPDPLLFLHHQAVQVEFDGRLEAVADGAVAEVFEGDAASVGAVFRRTQVLVAAESAPTIAVRSSL
jgi:hypothetical protein